MSDTILRDSLEQHGLVPASIDMDLARQWEAVTLHGIPHLELLRRGGRWVLVDVLGGTLGPTVVWERAQALRAEARLLDRLLGVLEDLGHKIAPPIAPPDAEE